MTNDKEIIKKLISIAQKQQKIITKLAQAQDPFQTHTGLPGDPLDPGDLGAPSAPQKGKAAPTPAPAPSPDRNALPGELKSALDTGTPKLKGSLLLTVNGKSVSVAFNADRVKQRPTDVKNEIAGALSGAGYSVSDVVGHMNPSWKANY